MSGFGSWTSSAFPGRFWPGNGENGETPQPAPAPASKLQEIGVIRGLSGDANTRFLHVAEQGAVLGKAGGRLRVSKQKDVLLQVPAVKLQGVLVYGKVQVTNQCLRFLMDEGVWLSFFSRSGTYHGRIQPPAERGGHLRRIQWERQRDEAFCLAFAKAVVRGKLLSAKTFASAQAKNRLAETLGEGHRLLRESLERVEAAASLDQLRGIEGTGARAYFDLFRRWNVSGFPFEGREKRGAIDPVNILLNFGYSLLARELDGLIESGGLDPAAGFYHQPFYDRPSLACDLLEEFRHELVDRLVLRLVNSKAITAEDFEDHGDRGLRFGKTGVRKYVTAYETLLVGSDGDSGFRETFLKQLARLLDAVRDGSAYRSHLEECDAARGLL